jgi:hypothetical protein
VGVPKKVMSERCLEGCKEFLPGEKGHSGCNEKQMNAWTHERGPRCWVELEMLLWGESREAGGRQEP